MHTSPSPKRLRSMTVSYLLFVPLTVPILRVCRNHWLPLSCGENEWVGVVHAVLFGLLFFLLFVECFYHIERSVTLRLLVEILARETGAPVSLRDIQAEYSVEDMVARRLELLRSRKFVAHGPAGWYLCRKGVLFAQAMRASCRLFQSQTQDERL
jgi:hypothetical protein